ncbi:MAG TPA: class I SAM-dependent methyltransferase [Dehalococcoidia bacterium]
MDVLRGASRQELDAAAFRALAAAYRQVLLDVGTGDGAYPYRYAREHPDTLCIGLDANRDGMWDYAARAARKPARGGLDNVLYVVAAIERPPPELDGVAHRLTVHFPWGSLLRGLVLPEPRILAHLRRLAAPGCHLEILFNYTALTDPAAAASQGVPVTDRDRVDRNLRPAYAAAGLHVTEVSLVGAETPAATRWGKRLTLGAGRDVLLLRGTVRHPWPAAPGRPLRAG